MLRLKELREKRGISQAKLANELGFAQNTLSNWEIGTRFPDAETLLKIASYFNVTVDYLLGNEEKKSSAKAEGEEDSELLNKTLNELLEQQDGMLLFDGKPLDDETKRLLIASLQNTIQMAKKMQELDSKKDDK